MTLFCSVSVRSCNCWRIAPGIIWVAALLSSLLALERLFRYDLQDGRVLNN
ncbi:heme exporter protein CcmB [Escherichia coli]